MITLQEAKELKPGDFVHCLGRFNADKTPMRAKVTSVKTWKRSPERVEVRYKRGLYEYGILREFDLNLFSLGYGS